MGSSEGELLGDNSVPVWVGLLDGKGGVAGNVAVVEWSADGVEGYGLGGEGSKAGLVKQIDSYAKSFMSISAVY